MKNIIEKFRLCEINYAFSIGKWYYINYAFRLGKLY